MLLRGVTIVIVTNDMHYVTKPLWAFYFGSDINVIYNKLCYTTNKE